MDAATFTANWNNMSPIDKFAFQCGMEAGEARHANIRINGDTQGAFERLRALAMELSANDTVVGGRAECVYKFDGWNRGYGFHDLVWCLLCNNASVDEIEKEESSIFWMMMQGNLYDVMGIPDGDPTVLDFIPNVAFVRGFVDGYVSTASQTVCN